MVTMKEIANKAGLSVSTVSLVLNGRDEGRVKSKIADNVRAIATKLGCQSNPLASSLRTGRTHILGFISEEVATTPYAGGMILGAQTAASQDAGRVGARGVAAGRVAVFVFHVRQQGIRPGAGVG